MRGYREKMAKYRLPPGRVRQIRVFCLLADRKERDMIESAADEACGDALAGWIVRHVTSTDSSWPQLEADNIPCGIDTFRVVRARFYFTLDKKMAALEKIPPWGVPGGLDLDPTPQQDAAHRPGE